MEELDPSATRGGKIVKPFDSQREDSVLSDEDSYDIPSFNELSRKYEEKWLKQRAEFYAKLKDNFRALTSQYRTGRQEIYSLTVNSYTDRYIKAFRELFSDSGYQASVGEVERSASSNVKTQKLSIVLPDCVK